MNNLNSAPKQYGAALLLYLMRLLLCQYKIKITFQYKFGIGVTLKE
jgi:hypothetical protein